jgi:transposase
MAESEPTCPGCRERDGIILRLQERVATLEKGLEELERRSHRQAAPFSRDKRKDAPKRPGQKPGHPGAHRAVPAKVDRVLDAPLPAACPGCGEKLLDEGVLPQYQTDLPPVTPVTTQFDVHVGHCCGCGRRVQGRHPLQTSDALGAAAVHFGPRLVAMGLELHVRLGLSFRKVAEFLVRYLDMKAAPSTFARTMRRMAKRMRGTREEILQALRASAVSHGDGTGWRVGGESACLHTVCTRTEALYLVDRRWGADPTIEVLGEDYAGVFVSDGLPAFEKLSWWRQRCIPHLQRFAKEIEALQTRGAVLYPRAVKALLQDALALGKKVEDLAESTFRRTLRSLETRLEALLFADLRNQDNARLRGRLWTAAPHLFTFLEVPGVPGDNNEAERTLRPAVVARKLSAGNRTWEGAKAWADVASVIETKRRQGEDFISYVAFILRPPVAPPAPQFEPALAVMTR